MRKGLSAVFLLGCAMIMLAVPGCQGSRAVPDAEAEVRPGFAGMLLNYQELMDLTARREPAYSEYDLLYQGKWFSASLPHPRVSISGNSALFSPTFGDVNGRNQANLAYCYYVFYIDSSYAEEDEINYGWEVPPADMSKAWMGLAHNGAEHWNWFRCNANGRQHVMSLGGYFNGDPLFVVFVLADDEPARLRYIRLGASTIEAHIHTSPSRSFSPLVATFDASGSTAGISEIIRYEWDWNGDGVFEENTGDMSTAGHTYSGIGTYHPAVRVTSEYGEQDTASMEVMVAAEWVHSWGTDADEKISGVAADADLNCYGVGRIGEDQDADLLLLKWNLNGSLVWARTWGGVDYENGVDIIADSEGGFFVLGCTKSYGAGSYDILLQRWDTSGNVDWSRTWGGSGNDSGNRLSLRDEGLYVAGVTNGFGDPDGDALVVKFSTSGDCIWARGIGENGYDFARDIRAFKPYSLPTTGVHVAGATESYSSGSSELDVMYLKLTQDGEVSKTLTWSGADSQAGEAISVSGLSGEDIYIGGAGGNGVLLLQVGTSGDLVSTVWNAGSGAFELVGDMVRLGNSFLICGNMGDYPDQWDFLLNLSPDGAVQGCETWWTSASADSWLGIAGHPAGALAGGYTYAAGSSSGEWHDFTGEIPDISGNWTEHSVAPAILDGQSGSPSAAAVDFTSEGVVDSGVGNDVDALMSAHKVP